LSGGLPQETLNKLINYPRDDQNKKYLVTSANYELESDDYITGGGGDGRVFNCNFTALDVEQPYRSPRITPKPVVQGPQTAIVVGKAGEEIWTDEHGRIKVQFHWDRYGKSDENSSCWIRVAQVWAGKNWGGMFIPRIGQEGIVEFLEGDPDHPIITGRVYNGISKTPYELPANATISGIKSLSSKGGAGFNEIRFEDKKGEEQIFVHGEKNYDLRIKNDRYEWIGNDRHLIVKKDKFEHVENERHEVVDNHHYEKIGGDHHLKIDGKEAISVTGSHSFTVTGDVIEVFKANHSEQTTQNYYLKAMGVVIEAMTGITLKCGGSNVVIDPSGVTIKGPMVTVDGSMVRIASGPGSPPMSGTAGSAVSAAAPTEALEADNADPGSMAEIKAAQQQKKAGKYGKIEVKPYKKKQLSDSSGAGTGDDNSKEIHWIEIKLVDEEGEPVPGERYEIKLSDGSVIKGTLDNEGFARVDGIEDPGSAEITFPELDESGVEPS
jgi:type VI secretion system secreted protein VgrG